MIVKDLFTLNEAYGNCRVLAGSGGLNREIKRVEITEVPDGVFWTQEGSFMVTTGYALKKGDVTPESFVSVLVDRKAAALGIKMGRYIEEFPQRVIDFADENNFPIISVPFQLTYAQITNPVDMRLMDSEKFSFHTVEHLRNDIRNAIKTNYTLDALLSLFTAYTGRKAVVCRASDFQVIAGNLSTPAPRLSSNLRDNIRTIYRGGDGIEISGGERKFRVFKIETACSLPALFCAEDDSGSAFSEKDIRVISELLPSITIFLLSGTSIATGGSGTRDDFIFKALMDEYSENELALCKDAVFLGVDEQRNRVCAVLEATCNISDITDRQKMETLRRSSGICCCRVIKNQMVIVCEIENDVTDIRTCWSDSAVSSALSRCISMEKFSIGVSNICSSLLKLHYTYNEASFALKVGRRLKKSSPVFFYEDYMIYDLISDLAQFPAMTNIYRNTVERLRKADELNGQDYLKTLCCLMEHNFSIAETSQALFIHRNTLYKRIKKIDSILNFDIGKTDNQLLIQLALRTDEIVHDA